MENQNTPMGYIDYIIFHDICQEKLISDLKNHVDRVSGKGT